MVVIWLLGITGWLISLSMLAMSESPLNPPALSTRWESNGLRIMGADGRWLLTHLENASEGTFARLPEPVWLVESGGVWIAATNLAKLNWTSRADPFKDALTTRNGATAPGASAEIRALYVIMEKSNFLSR